VVTVSRNLGGNTFAPPVNLPLGTNVLINPSPVSLALSDVDDDADLDIVLVSVNDAQEQRVRVIRNTSASGGGLSFTSIADTPNQPIGTPLIVRSADLDGDSPFIADDIVVLVDPFANITSGQSGLNSIDLSGSFCPADINNDGVFDFFDISAFLIAYGAGLPSADFNADGVFDFFDVSSFLTTFMSQCGS